MILLSNGGTNIQRAQSPSDAILIGTVDGVALLGKSERGWSVKHRAMQGVFVSGVTALDDGTLFASTRGVGMARSDDGGIKWTWVNDGLAHHEFWSCRGGQLQGRDVVFAGALPAHLYASEDKGKSWRELKAFRDAKTVRQWTFPPPPRIGHIKDIVIDGGKSFQRMKMPSEANYPDAVVIHPDQPDLLFMTAGVGWPVHWYELGRARGKIFRSRDAGVTWERLLGGLPNGQRALFSGLTIEARKDGYSLHAVDTDGQVFESLDGGDSWTIIADVPPVSKADFYKGLVRDRVKLANVDDIVANPTATKRWQEAGKGL